MRRCRRTTGVDVFPLRLLDFGPFAAVEAVVEYQTLLLAGRLALADATLGRGVLGRLQLRGHGPFAALHRWQVLEGCVLEIEVRLARRLLLALVTEVAVGFACDSVAELLGRSFGNGIFLGRT